MMNDAPVVEQKFAFLADFLYLLSIGNSTPALKSSRRLPPVRYILAAFFFAPFLCPPAIRAQAGPVEGGHEWQVWTGEGHGVSGSQSSDGVWNVGFRYGLILTAPHGPGFLRGRLEYAADAVPVFLVFQKTNTAYGAGLNPFAFKWMLDTKHSVAPYFEIGGGTLFTNTRVPEGTSRVNFTSGAALGLHFLRAKHNISAEVRYMHISNAGLATPNPGINTIQFRLGFGAFSQKE